MTCLRPKACEQNSHRYGRFGPSAWVNVSEPAGLYIVHRRKRDEGGGHTHQDMTLQVVEARKGVAALQADERRGSGSGRLYRNGCHR